MTVVYSKNDCIQCERTKMLLNAANIPFEERNIDNDEDALAKVKEYGFLSAPVIVPDDESGLQPWYGFRPDLLRELKTK